MDGLALKVTILVVVVNDLLLRFSDKTSVVHKISRICEPYCCTTTKGPNWHSFLVSLPTIPFCQPNNDISHFSQVTGFGL